MKTLIFNEIILHKKRLFEIKSFCLQKQISNIKLITKQTINLQNLPDLNLKDNFINIFIIKQIQIVLKVFI